MMQSRDEHSSNWRRKLVGRWARLVVGLTLAGFVAGCGKPVQVASKWRSFELDMKETGNDWGSAAVYAEKEQVSLSVLNDSTHIFIRLYSRAHGMQGQIIGMGFTIWFDPKGGQNKFVGIHFPLGRMNYGMSMMDRREMERPPKPDEMSEIPFDEMNELEIVTPGNQESHRVALAIAENLGISVKLGRLQGGLVYQLKMPFSEIGFSVVGADTPATIGVGFETSKMDRGGPGGVMGGSMPPRDPKGMPGGGMPGQGPPGAGERSRQLSLWTAVRLVSSPAVQK